MLLKSAREPLEAKRLEGISELVAQCYRRAAHLVDSLSAVPDDQLDASLDGLISIREILTSEEVDVQGQAAADEATRDDRQSLDADLFYDALHRLIRDTGTPPRSEIAGAAAGLLHGAGRIEERRVCEVVQHFLDAAVQDVSDACGVVRGLMMTAREAFWRMDPLLRSVDELFRRWEEERFVNALPHLRLAFSQLSPKEVDSVAGRVASLHEVDEIGPLVSPEITEDEMQLAVMVSELMNRSLREDGLI
jgi:hypothetical protein